MTELYARYGVPAAQAQRFIVQQAGFDLLTGNIDRKQNYANTIFIAGSATNVLPLNFDYGRCFQSMYNDTADNRFASGAETLDDELVSMYLEDFFNDCGGILGCSRDYATNARFIVAHGFTPFKVDVARLHAELVACRKRVTAVRPELRYFVELKTQLLLGALRDARNQQMWEAV
jgi:hypothetical protein